MTQPTNIFSNNTTFFSDPVSDRAKNDLMNLQAATNVPQNTSAFTNVSDPLIPDRNLIDRLGHFDPELYDLRDTSHLMKLMRAMLGGAGVGGLRKQIAIARLQNSFHTTHFLDLDRFYGALFGIGRTKAEIFPDYGTKPSDTPDEVAITYNLHDATQLAAGTIVPGQFVLGEEFTVTKQLSLRALRYWRPNINVTANNGAIFNVATGVEVPGTRVTFADAPTSSLPAWHAQSTASPVILDPGRYRVAVVFQNQFYFQNQFFTTGPAASGIAVGPATLVSKNGATGGAQGSYLAAPTGVLAYPTSSDGNGATWGLDITYTEVVSNSTATVGGQFDPYTDAAGSDVWDDIHSRDASYRSRLIKFARAIPQGGTYAGLLAAMEALLNVECELYEAWSWIDEIGGSTAVINRYTYAQMERTFKNWGVLSTNHTWSDFTGEVVSVGRVGQPNRGEVVLKPKRALREDEKYQTLRVLRQLAPAGTQFTVDPGGVALHRQQALRAVAASSEYWEVVSRVIPSTSLTKTAQQSYTSSADPSGQQPRPAFSQYTGEKWSYNNDVATISSYEMVGDTPLTANDYETVTYADGTSHKYLPSDGLIPGQQAAAARLTADGVCTSAPYCPPRKANVTISVGLSVKIGAILRTAIQAKVVKR